MWFFALLFFTNFCMYCSASQSEFLDPAFYHWCQETREIENQPYDALINLGGTCQVAYQMRLWGIRNEALPFDWVITPFDSLYAVLTHTFDDFLNESNLEFIETEKEKYVVDKKYGIRFLHDFKLEPNFIKDYNKIKSTYDRRIERFLKILQNSRHALFIRKNINKQEALDLRNLLRKLCPDNTFILLVADTTNQMKEDWDLDQIKNFYLSPPEPASWKGDAAAWQEIFTAVGLQLSLDDSVRLFAS